MQIWFLNLQLGCEFCWVHLHLLNVLEAFQQMEFEVKSMGQLGAIALVLTGRPVLRNFHGFKVALEFFQHVPTMREVLMTFERE